MSERVRHALLSARPPYDRDMPGEAVDVLVVGAGPTGLMLAAELATMGVRSRLIDRARDRVRESRALAIQPRSLEVLARIGITDQLVESGNQAVQVCIHAGPRETSVPLFDLGMADTAYPYLLFLSQAETERIIGERLADLGVVVERGVELVDLRSDNDAVTARLRRDDGPDEQISVRYVVGADGAHSRVRELAGIGFEGGSYPQSFVLADCEADGIAPDGAHAFLSDRGMLFFFPLGSPVGWRLLAMRPLSDRTPADAAVTLREVQTLADAYTDGTVRLHDPLWMTNFRLHHRAANRYRSGRMFLAGDAAHIHSPAGAQGMNTGIQDAVNLGWKLAHAVGGRCDSTILDTYEPERAPVGRTVLRFTDRAFTIATSDARLIRFARTRVAPILLPLALKPRAIRAYAFRMLSQLAIRYRASALSLDGPGSPRRGPRAGDRLPDGPVSRNGRQTRLHAVIASPGWHLIRCGPANAWPRAEHVSISDRHTGLMSVHHLSATSGPGMLTDIDGRMLRRLGLGTGGSAQYLVRPDGHIGYRSGVADDGGLIKYLRRWLPARN
jgi:2-polyprenyl-6-methoxyphenol hydroxylase-like FAD-dependent oxidoreductase